MIQRAFTIPTEDCLRRSELHVNDREVVTETVVNLSGQAVTLLSDCQLFFLRGILSQLAVRLAQAGARLSLARRDPRKDHHQEDPGAVGECDGEGINPTIDQD